MQLGKVLNNLEVANNYPKDMEISTIELNSQKVTTGSLFVAVSGVHFDGKDYIPEAINNGAVAIVYSGEYTSNNENITFIRLEGNMKENIAKIAANFYTAVPKLISAVTGTNGKTSIADFNRQMMSALGYHAASIGTLGVVSDVAGKIETLTTPDSITMHQIMANLSANGVDYVSMEASSIGLEQYRLDGLDIKVAGFTNFTQDHLDYHGSMNTYLKCKELLFQRVMSTKGTAVLNADIPEFAELQEVCLNRGIKVISYGYNGNELKLLSLIPHTEGQSLEVEIMGKPYIFELPLIGAFQAMNVLCAIGMVIALSGESTDKIVDAAKKLHGAEGRLDLVGRLTNGAAVYIDYAHTPDALENVLKTMRNHTGKELWVIFGCGGDRDKLKRPIMGKIAQELADRVIVTDDNPRSEDAATIREEVMVGCPDAVDIGDRAEAIKYAVSGLQSGDMLIIAGKGHEDYQIVGNQKFHLSDREEAIKAIVGIG